MIKIIFNNSYPSYLTEYNQRKKSLIKYSFFWSIFVKLLVDSLFQCYSLFHFLYKLE